MIGYKTADTGKIVFCDCATDEVNKSNFIAGTDLLPFLNAHLGTTQDLVFSNGAKIRLIIGEYNETLGIPVYEYFINSAGETVLTYNSYIPKRATAYYVARTYPFNVGIDEVTKFGGQCWEGSDGLLSWGQGFYTVPSGFDPVTFFSGADPVLFFPGEISDEDGGDGSFDAESDEIGFPTTPSLSAVSAGFITLYAPTIGQLNDLASYMWSDDFDLDMFKKLFADPMDAIIGLSIVPVAVPIAGAQEIKIGLISTGVTMNLASSQYLTLDCGSLSIEEFWGGALDYAPYTKFSIYLPYIGTRELNADDIMGRTIQVKYNIDILSGACTAMVKCGNAVLYQFSGACASSIPVTGQNWTQLITSCIQLAGAGIAVAASGGSVAGLLPSTANAVMAMKPNIQRVGAVSGSAGMLGVQKPYLIWELPRQSLAKNYNKFVGYPSNITALLSTLTGYTQIESVHLENIPATQLELAEIETLLKEGVII